MFVSDKTISKWESNRSVPDVQTIKQLAIILNVEYDVLIDGENASSNKDTLLTRFTTFTKNYLNEVIYGGILLTLMILVNVLEDSLSYFTMYVSLLLFITHQIIKRSKWYFIALLLVLMQFIDEMNTYLHIGSDLWFFSIFMITVLIMLIALIVITIKATKNGNNYFISVLMGNIISVLILLSIALPFGVGWHESYVVNSGYIAEGYITLEKGLLLPSLLFYLIIYIQLFVIDPRLQKKS